MAANNDGGTSGDKVYTVNLAVPEQSVSVMESKQFKNLSIFPNPSNGKFQIGVGDVEIATDSYVQIFDAQGKLVYQSSISNSKSEIDLSNKPAGIYFVKVYNGSTILSGKVIVSL
jgi:NADPH-dependent 7-cyano-7-deazaguanine reductase QueF-like protein